MLKKNLPIYNIERVITQTGELFNDRSHIIYVNSQIRDETALGKLMSDFHSREPKGMNYPVLEEKSEFYKYGGGQSNMCRLVEELVVNYSEETTIKFIKSMLSKNKYSYEEIADITDVSVEKVKEIADSLHE